MDGGGTDISDCSGDELSAQREVEARGVEDWDRGTSVEDPSNHSQPEDEQRPGGCIVVVVAL